MKELFYFFDWLKEHRLTVGAISMWLCLMFINNRCALPALSGEWLWRVEFSAANYRIEQALHCSERQIMRYRKELVDCGRIRYRSGTGGAAGIYTLIPLRPNVIAKETGHVLSEKTTLVYVYDGANACLCAEKKTSKG